MRSTLLLCAFMGACGSTPMNPASMSYQYETQATPASAAAALAAYNAKAAAGFAFAGPLFSLAGSLDLFIKPTPAAAFSYAKVALDASTQTRAGYLAMLDAQGANGFAYKGSIVFGSSSHVFFVKDTTRTATYTYLTDPLCTDKTSCEMLFNQRGAAGYTFIASVVPNLLDATASSHIFQKTGMATYSYSMAAMLSERQALSAEMNTRGAKGDIWRGPYVTGGAQFTLYEKASTTTGPITCALDDDASGAALIAALDARGNNGFLYFGPYFASSVSLIAYCKGATPSLPLLGTVFP